MRTLTHSPIALVLATLTTAGCSAGGGASAAPFSTGAENGVNGAPGSGTQAPFGSGTQSPPIIAPIMPILGGGADGGACQAVVQQAEKISGRADIVFILDNSGSMGQEVSAVQSNLNTFSQQIAGSGIDTHVVVISSLPGGGAGGNQCVDPTGIACAFVPGLTVGGLVNGNGVCIAPPLGAQGACPQGDDSNPAAGFLHVKQAVDSHNALAMVEQTYSSWQQMLRPDAAKTFVVITDDESQVAAQDFSAWVSGQAAFQKAVWRFSGIFCTAGSLNCANVGTVYSTLVMQTGGVAGNLGELSDGQVDAQFKTVFDSLAKAVVKDARPVDCQWTIPAPPAGQTLDPQAVNVRYSTAASVNQTIYGVDGADKCTDQYGGWYYDNGASPTHVLACPQTCKVLQADLSTRVEVLFGCARKIAPVR